MAGDKDPTIAILESEAEEKDKYISFLEDKLTASEWYKNAYKDSVLAVTENFNIPEPDPLTPPEKAPELFLGKQAESMAFLEKHYGQYLTYFGAEKNLLFQYQLTKLDKRLASAVRGSLNYQRKKDSSMPTYTEVIPPKSAEIDQELEGISHKDELNIARLYSSSSYRKKKSL